MLFKVIKLPRHARHTPRRASIASSSTAAVRATTQVRPVTPQPTPLDVTNGFVQNEACLSKVPACWHQLLDGIVAAYQQACGSHLLGVYLRGSLPRGYFLPGISDVDTYAILLPQGQGMADQQQPQLNISNAAEDRQAAGQQGQKHSNSSSSSMCSGTGSFSGRNGDASAGQCAAADSNVSGSWEWQQRMQQHVQAIIDPLLQQHAHLQFSKVEVKIRQVQPGSAAAAALQQHRQALVATAPSVGIPRLQRQLSSHTTASTAPLSLSQHSNNSSIASSSSGGSSTRLPTLTPAMVPSIPFAFELKSQSVCLWGVDLLLLLPDAAALSHPVLLPALADDIEAATKKYQEAQAAEDIKQKVSLTRWCLKRLLRAAFELVEQQANVWTRDLYWCCHYSSVHLPHLQHELEQALQLYIELQGVGPQQYVQLPPVEDVQHELHVQQQHQQPQQSDEDVLADQHVQQMVDFVHNQQAWGQLDSWQQQNKRPRQQQQLSGQQQKDLARLDTAWQLISSLFSKVETAFVKQMIAEEPGWLTKHIGCPVPAVGTATNGITSSNTNTITVPNSSSSSTCSSCDSRSQRVSDNSSNCQKHTKAKVAGQPDTSGWQSALQSVQWLFQQLPGGGRYAAKAAGVGENSTAAELQWLLGAAPPPVQIPIWGKVTEYNWEDAVARQEAVAAIKSALLGHSACSSHDAASDNVVMAAATAATTTSAATAAAATAAALSASQELFSCYPQPIVLRNAAAQWPAVAEQQWSLGWLCQQGFSGKVKVAPSLQFPFCEPQVLDLLQQIRGPPVAPSLELDMSVAEFVQRLQPSCPLPKLAFSPNEFYYMQAKLPQDLLQQLRLQELLAAIGSAAGTANNGSSSANVASSSEPATAGYGSGESSSSTSSTSGAPFKLSQSARLWVSPVGAISALHYDKSHSFLVQMRGYKRMLFFSPDQLYRLYCYPDTHLLRRRSRVNVCAPDYKQFPLIKNVGALEAVLGPSDVVFFPPHWAHYTESLGDTPGIVSHSRISNAASSSSNIAAGFCASVTFRVAGSN